MSNITERVNKNGEISYLIRAFLSEDKFGRQKVKSMTWRPKPGMSQKQIEKALQSESVRFEDAVRNGIVCFDGNTTFESFSSEFMRLAQISYRTRERYNEFLKRINPAIGHIKLSKLQAHHLESLYANLAEDGINKKGAYAVTSKLIPIMKERKLTIATLSKVSGISSSTITSARLGRKIGIDSATAISDALGISPDRLFEIHMDTKGLSEKTIRDHHRLISVILAKAKRERIVTYNVAKEHATAPKVQVKEARYLNEEEAALFASKLLDEKDIRVKAALLILIYSGIRRGELCGLDWQDIDYEKCLIHIRKARQYQRGKGTVVVPTKNRSSQRSIKLPAWVFEVLKSYQLWWKQQKLICGERWEGEDSPIFIQEDGKPINPDTINYWLKRFTRSNGLADINPHGLRHTFATLQITAGVDIRTLQARTGHAQASTLINIYSHELKSAEAAASDALDSMLIPKIQPKIV